MRRSATHLPSWQVWEQVSTHFVRISSPSSQLIVFLLILRDNVGIAASSRTLKFGNLERCAWAFAHALLSWLPWLTDEKPEDVLCLSKIYEWRRGCIGSHHRHQIGDYTTRRYRKAEAAMIWQAGHCTDEGYPIDEEVGKKWWSFVDIQASRWLGGNHEVGLAARETSDQMTDSASHHISTRLNRHIRVLFTVTTNRQHTTPPFFTK